MHEEQQLAIRFAPRTCRSALSALIVLIELFLQYFSFSQVCNEYFFNFVEIRKKKS